MIHEIQCQKCGSTKLKMNADGTGLCILCGEALTHEGQDDIMADIYKQHLQQESGRMDRQKILMEMRHDYHVLKDEDVRKYCSPEEVKFVGLADIGIAYGRVQDGKPANSYIVINIDEPYIQEIIDVLKRHGHWAGAGE